MRGVEVALEKVRGWISVCVCVYVFEAYVPVCVYRGVNYPVADRLERVCIPVLYIYNLYA